MSFDENYDPFSQFTRIMRMSNIFAPQDVNSYQTPQSVMPDDYNPITRMQQLYQPRTDITNMYTNALSNFPQRQQPGGLSKIAAIMSGLGAGVGPVGISGGQPIGFQGNPALAMQTFDQALNAPYYRQLADFENRAKMLREGALIEDRYNTDARILANQMVAQELADRRLTETERKNKEAERINNQKLELQRLRAEAYDFKTRNPNYQGKIDENGELVYINPQDPTKIVRTGIDTGKLSDADKINLQIGGRLKTIGAQGVQTRENIKTRAEEESKLIGTRSKETQEQIKLRGEETRKTNENKAINPPTAVQQKTAIFNRAQEAKNTKPEWNRWIKVQTNGEVVITPPKTSIWSSGPSLEEHKKINEFIYGSERKVGDTKILSNGKTGVWNGKVWVVQ